MQIDIQTDHGNRECPSCACEVPVNNNRCPICGYEFPHAAPRQKFLRYGGAVIMLGILCWMLFHHLWK